MRSQSRNSGTAISLPASRRWPELSMSEIGVLSGQTESKLCANLRTTRCISGSQNRWSAGRQVLGPFRQFPAGGSPCNQTARRNAYEEIPLPAGLCAGTSPRLRCYAAAVKQFRFQCIAVPIATLKHVRPDTESTTTFKHTESITTFKHTESITTFKHTESDTTFKHTESD